jgi:DNA-binding NtrC family response regulator
MARICLIEDDAIMGEALVQRLELEGYAVDWQHTGCDGLVALIERGADLAIIDVSLPDITGVEVFERLLAAVAAPPPCLFITGYGTIEDAVRLLKLGAADYLTKPLSPAALIAKLRALAGSPCGAPGSSPGSSRGGAPARVDEERLGLSAAMQRVERELARIARHPETPVLIGGESGVGKEVVARRLHALQCPTAPFVAVNCAALPEGLIESELFGHEKGAFTGATVQRRGVFEQAGQGTLFLDEIGDMPLGLQARLLRVVQERRLTRLGGARAIEVPARLVCATHQDLEALVRTGRFREDLYYRVKVLELQIPPLRERPEDILWLTERFLAEHGRRFPDERRMLRREDRERLLRYGWSGNVRELHHVLERACILGEGQHLRLSVPGLGDGDAKPLKASAEAGERAAILAALAEHSESLAVVAAALGISRKTLWQRMKRYGLSR